LSGNLQEHGMDFSLTQEQQAFRAQVRAFFAEERVAKVCHQLRTLPPREEPGVHDIYRWLGERGWLAPTWPVEYGGLGAGPVHGAIVSEEMSLHGVPDLVHALSVDIVGLFLLRFGTDAQKARYLPPIARGERSATVLYSEPSVGSDLAALETRAIPDGDGWRLHGRKLYNQKTQFADNAVCAARTTQGASKYAGITLFFVDLRAEGVHVGPLWNLSDDRFNDVTLLDVRVTPDQVIGPLDGGWEVIKSVLALERTGLDFQARIRRWLDLVLARAIETGRIQDPCVAGELVALDAEVQAGRLLAWRVISQLDRDELDEAAAAMSKWYNTELGRRIARMAMELEGLDGTLSRWDGAGEAPLGGMLEAVARESPGLTLSAGSSEIMLYVISATGLKVFEEGGPKRTSA
jgi:alkylation response protein AidB-like acyl-CoA dehydrogenase